jgi:hypothetical protein
MNKTSIPRPTPRRVGTFVCRLACGFASLDIRFTLVRPWNWKAEAKTATGPILACTYPLGHDLPLRSTL